MSMRKSKELFHTVRELNGPRFRVLVSLVVKLLKKDKKAQNSSCKEKSSGELRAFFGVEVCLSHHCSCPAQNEAFHSESAMRAPRGRRTHHLCTRVIDR